MTAAQVYFGVLNSTRNVQPFFTLFLLHLVDWLPWAVLTPFILWLGRTYTISRDGWFSALLVHLPVSIFIALMFILSENVILFWYESVPFSLPRFLQNYGFIAAHHFHTLLLMYWLILSIGYGFQYYRKFRDRDKSALALERRLLELEGPQDSGRYIDRLVIKSYGRITFLKARDIDWIEAADYYVQIHAKGRPYLLRESMNLLEKKLDPEQFARIHRSAIVNVDRIKELRPHNGGDYRVILTDGTELKLARSRRKSLKF